MRKVLGLLDKRVNEFEKRCLQRLLKKTNGNLRQVALMMDIRRTRLYRMMKRHGIKIADYRHAHSR